jgi:hypothetical protein
LERGRVDVAGGARVLAKEQGEDSLQLLDVLRWTGVEGVLDERVLSAGLPAEGALERGVGAQAREALPMETRGSLFGRKESMV